jgi:hypothetical protein
MPNPNSANIQDNYAMIREELMSNGYTENMSQIVTAQSMWETANFTSEVFNANNNMFGMRQPKSRETTSRGELGNYASYDNTLESVKDLELWFKAKGDTANDYANSDLYVQYLKSKNYFSDTLVHYRTGVAACFKVLQSEIAAG